MNDTNAEVEQAFTSEVEQYTYDQSLANEENTGMMASVFANLIILAITVAVIVFFARHKKHKGS